MSKTKDVYGEPTVYELPNGKGIATVYRPILTEEEYNRRMKRIEESARRLIESAYRQKMLQAKRNEELRKEEMV